MTEPIALCSHCRQPCELGENGRDVEAAGQVGVAVRLEHSEHHWVVLGDGRVVSDELDECYRTACVSVCSRGRTRKTCVSVFAPLFMAGKRQRERGRTGARRPQHRGRVTVSPRLRHPGYSVDGHPLTSEEGKALMLAYLSELEKTL